ncbi:MAG: SAM-dependent methyltransferase [Pseudomonadota bacterium]
MLENGDSEAIGRTTEMRVLLRDRIAVAGGMIGFDEFMRTALYDPELGYYEQGTIFGAAGDFVTASELGPLFAQCLATQCVELFDHIEPAITEFGAGAGQMAVDLIKELDRQGVAPERYTIIEPSAGLRTRQQELVESSLAPRLVERFAWRPSLSGDDCLTGVAIANEVLDALPAKRFRVLDGGSLVELGVGVEGQDFRWVEGGVFEPDMTLAAAELPQSAALGVGFQSEIHTDLCQWMRKLVPADDGCVVLVCDYGYPAHEYYHPSRRDGTLKCYFKHRLVDDPFAQPGAQDLTVAVNFTMLANLAFDAGFELAGYTTQAGFLLATGLLERLDQGVAGEQRVDSTNEAKRLILAGEMGETFKVMALSNNCDAHLRGFINDYRHRLAPMA